MGIDVVDVWKTDSIIQECRIDENVCADLPDSTVYWMVITINGFVCIGSQKRLYEIDFQISEKGSQSSLPWMHVKTLQWSQRSHQDVNAGTNTLRQAPYVEGCWGFPCLKTQQIVRTPISYFSVLFLLFEFCDLSCSCVLSSFICVVSSFYFHLILYFRKYR